MMIFRQLGVLGLAAALLAGCDSSPTEPKSPARTPQPAAAQGQLTITLSGAEGNQLSVGASAVIEIRSPIASVEVGISTDLGNFGTDGGGNPIRVASVAVDANGRGQIPFFAGDTSGIANIVANLGEDTTEPLQVTITAGPLLFLSGVDPHFGLPRGGDRVTLHGQGFSTEPARPMRVTFGGALAEIDTDIDPVTATLCVVVTPQSKEPVPVGQTLVVDVTVTIAATDTQEAMTDTLEGAFTYAHGDSPIGPAVYSVVPATGSNQGGDRVTLNGTGFEKPVYVAFGFGATPADFNGSEAEVRNVRKASIVVTTPRARPSMLNQAVDVLVRNLETGLATVAPAIFTYVEQGVISDIQPRNASYTGTFNADAVVITGQGFDRRSSLTIEFGGGVQPGGTVSEDGTTIRYEEIEAVSVQDCAPPSGPVIVSNLVTGEIAQSSAIFSYLAESPSLLAIDPPEGPEGGGIEVTLTGVFSEQELVAASLLVNGTNALIIAGDESTIIFRAPAFTGSFEETPCDGGAGNQYVPAAVDVELVYLTTGCRDRVAGFFSYRPADASCRLQQPPVPSFAFGPDPDDVLTVLFTNTTDSATADTWQWLFGDGASANVEQPGAHTYAAAGTYTVILQATNAGGSGSFSQVVTVPLPGTVPDPPAAGFTFSVDDAARTVFFTDTSTNDPTSWEWFFGDGTTGNDQHPTHVYDQAGSFTVTLRATNAGGTGSFSQEVTIAAPDPPVASFGFSINPSNNLAAIFVDTSTGSPTSWTWLFGDGTTSNAQHPTHGYAAAGTYTVTLQATNAGGTGSFTQPVTVGP